MVVFERVKTGKDIGEVQRFEVYPNASPLMEKMKVVSPLGMP
jgi:hypothetical protein